MGHMSKHIIFLKVFNYVKIDNISKYIAHNECLALASLLLKIVVTLGVSQSDGMKVCVSDCYLQKMSNFARKFL